MEICRVIVHVLNLGSINSLKDNQRLHIQMTLTEKLSMLQVIYINKYLNMAHKLMVINYKSRICDISAYVQSKIVKVLKIMLLL